MDLARDLGTQLVHVETSFATVLDDIDARRCHIAMMGVVPMIAAVFTGLTAESALEARRRSINPE